MISTEVPNGNCLFQSLSKDCLGQKIPRTRLLGFVYANSNIFMSHNQQRCQSQVDVRQYCLAVDASLGNRTWNTCCFYSATSTHV